MTDAPPPGSPPETSWPTPSWKKISEFVSGVFQLQRSVERLKEQNKALQAEVARLQRISDDHSGQLKTIIALIESTVNDRAVQRAEEAALRMVQQMMSLRQDPNNKE